ncbi:MAG: sulfite exporter TauE/SafE family protein [Promethearchaeota archaeon]|nr:MAG: sulfite exporter TauE/SafE family protein [Candidatus Lokiarchaeota archaeon]
MEITFIIIPILISLGFLTGVIAVIAGIGGGVLFVSIMTILFIIPINIAIDTSTFIILSSSAAGFITYLKQKRTSIKLSLFFSIFSILGSILTTILFLFVQIDNTLLRILFASTLLVAGGNMIFKAIKTKNSLKTPFLVKQSFSLDSHDYKPNFKKAIPLFLLAGFTANLLGIGGGIVNTPSLHIVLDYPIHYSTAISTSIIFFTAIYNTIIKAIIGEIDYIVGILVAIGSILGSITGAKISKRMPRLYLQFFVAIVLIILAIRMYF